MDCDTTGIEPDLSLVKYKKLAGGGSLRLLNRVVPRALARLGYGKAETEAIVRHLEREEGMEGAPHLRREHLAVFDCAFRPGRDGRVISAEGHLRMMAAVQPFLSGGISKTVNLPREATVEEIERLYLRGGELGLKALAVYREGSKGVEPLTTRCVIDEGHQSCCGG
jgi:ribonucleoside-diphosphate reductase alpha chain